MVHAFWAEVGEQGTPLIEPEGDEYLVTFLWRGLGHPENVLVFGALAGFADNHLRRIPGTDVWHRSYHAPADFLGTYWMSPNDPLTPPDRVEDWAARTASWQPDPLNPRTHPDFWYVTSPPLAKTVSVLALPEAPSHAEAERNPDVPLGRVTECGIASRILGNERPVWVYTPPGYDPAYEYDLLLLFDGHAYTYLIPTPTILDNLIAAGAIRPVVAVMPDSLGETRSRELTCYPPFVDFLATELLPWVRHRYSVSNQPARTVVGGSSFGGLAAMFAGLTGPDVFGNVLSQSGSFGWKPESESDWEWLGRQLTGHECFPLQVHMDVGRFESDDGPGQPSQLGSNRRLRDVLLAKGCRVHYEEFSGGHDTICWQGTLTSGLQVLLSPGEMR